jgi:hypothetical protein
MLSPGTLICPLGAGVAACVFGTGVLIWMMEPGEQPTTNTIITAIETKISSFIFIFFLRNWSE